MMLEKPHPLQRPLVLAAVVLGIGLIAGAVYAAVQLGATAADRATQPAASDGAMRRVAATAVGVPWLADDGTAFAVMVDPADLDAFLARRTARLAAEAQRIAADAEAFAAAESRAVFVRLIERVPHFTDWVYGWVESYFAAYLIAERAIERMIIGDDKGNTLSIGDAIEDGFRGVVSEKFEQIVVRPVEPQAAFAASWQRLTQSLAREWQAVLARDRQAWDDFLFARSQAGRSLEHRDPRLPICAVAPDLSGLEVDADRLQSRLDPEQADLFTLRFARPYAARVTIIGLRFAGLGPTLGAMGTFGAGLGASPSLAVAWTLASAAIWSADYLINLVDEALYRPEFEARLVGALTDAARLEARDTAAQAIGAISKAMVALSDCGAPPVIAGRLPARI